MVTKTVQFNHEGMLNMKAVAVLIQKASTFRSNIWLASGERRANAKSLLGVMSLGIENVKTLNISAEGTDESQAVDAIVAYLEDPQV